METLNRHRTSRGISFEPQSLRQYIRVRFRDWDERGQSMVEFALTIPILLALATAIFTFGIAFHNYLELTNAVNTGALVLAESRGAADPCAAASAQVYRVAPFLSRPNITFNYTFYSTDFYNTTGGTPTTLLTVSNSTSCTPTAAQMVAGGGGLLRVTYRLTPFGIYAYRLPSITLAAQTVQLIQ